MNVAHTFELKSFEEECGLLPEEAELQNQITRPEFLSEFRQLLETCQTLIEVARVNQTPCTGCNDGLWASFEDIFKQAGQSLEHAQQLLVVAHV